MTILMNLGIIDVVRVGELHHPLTDKRHAVVIFYNASVTGHRIVNFLVSITMDSIAKFNLQIMLDTKQIRKRE